MEWIERFNNVINYIEENITQQIDYEEIAKIACCSSYHFQRMFTYMAGIPLSEYIRKRKMSLAAVDLQSGDERVIDVAGKYGYNSPTAFNRAFQSIHGISPSAVKNGNVYVKSFPRLSFKLVVKGVEELNYRIETKEAFRIIGVSAPLSKELEKKFLLFRKCGRTVLKMERLKSYRKWFPLRQQVFWALAFVTTRNNGNTLLLLQHHRRIPNLKNTRFLRQHGRFFPELARINLSKN